MMERFNIGEAMRAIKEGHMVKRFGWSGEWLSYSQTNNTVIKNSAATMKVWDVVQADVLAEDWMIA
jgi:hypothetical protein